MRDQENKFPCPLCEEWLEIRLDEKHGKPYVICNLCGVQMFVRRERGIKLLEKRAKQIRFWGSLA
jgi:transcription elongation factor Elf1